MDSMLGLIISRKLMARASSFSAAVIYPCSSMKRIASSRRSLERSLKT